MYVVFTVKIALFRILLAFFSGQLPTSIVSPLTIKAFVSRVADGGLA